MVVLGSLKRRDRSVFVEAVDLLADEINTDATFSDLLEGDLEASDPPDEAADGETETTFEESSSRAADD